jgi:hypothetical protein
MPIIVWASLGGVGVGMGLYYCLNAGFFPDAEEPLASRPRAASELPKPPRLPKAFRMDTLTLMPLGRVVGLTKTQAEDLLDWLEACGHRGATLDWNPEQGFIVES